MTRLGIHWNWIACLLMGLLAGTGTLWSQCKLAPVTTVHMAALFPGLQFSVEKHGNHLLKAQTGRLVASGVLARKGQNASSVVMTLQLPNLVRLDRQTGGIFETLGFDGETQWKKAAGIRIAGTGLQQDDQDLLESLGYNLPEHFFAIFGTATPIRKLGSRFRSEDADGDRKTVRIYDIYQTMESVRAGEGSKQQAIYYYINSNTSMLERVEYQSVSGKKPFVQIFIDSWLETSGNRFSRTIRRLEEGSEIWRLDFDSVAFIPAAADTHFCAQ